jgi:predicted amidophosphoribosyltransferase
MTAPVRQAIHKKASEAEIVKAAAISGFTSLLEDARSKIRDATTTPEEVLRVIQLRDKDEKCCPRCSRPISGVDGACPSCKESARSVCVVCGSKVSRRWQFCPRCGKSVHRRLPKSDRAVFPDQTTDWGKYPHGIVQ